MPSLGIFSKCRFYFRRSEVGPEILHFWQNSQVTPILLVHRPHFEQQGHKPCLPKSSRHEVGQAAPWCQSGPKLISSFWYTIPVFIFVTPNCQMPTTAPDIITRHLAWPEKGRQEETAERPFPVWLTPFFSEGKMFWGGSNRLFLLSHMTRPTCKGCWESNYLAFPASILERGNRLGMACIRLCIYMCVCGIYTYIYTHICVYTYICSLF